MEWVSKLNPRQQRFVAEYLTDLNATQAAVRAGYSAKTAHSIGPRLLEHVDIAGALAEASQARQARTGITQDRVVAELALLAFSDVSHYTVDNQGNVVLSPDAPPTAYRAVVISAQ